MPKMLCSVVLCWFICL